MERSKDCVEKQGDCFNSVDGGKSRPNLSLAVSSSSKAQLSNSLEGKKRRQNRPTFRFSFSIILLSAFLVE